MVRKCKLKIKYTMVIIYNYTKYEIKYAVPTNSLLALLAQRLECC